MTDKTTPCATTACPYWPAPDGSCCGTYEYDPACDRAASARKVETPRWWASKFTLPNGGPSYCEMWGTESEVRTIAKRRRFEAPKKKSAVKKEMRASKLLNLPGGLCNPAVFHTVCYLGFLAVRSGVITAEELVRDGSALHELAHYMCCGDGIRGGTQRQVTIDAIRDLERRIPGIPPDEVEIL